MISRSELRTISVDCQGNLDGTEVIASIDAVTEQGTAHLTIANAQITTESMTINRRSVPAGKAIQFTVDARGADVKHRWDYAVIVKFITDTGQRITGGVKLVTD